MRKTMKTYEGLFLFPEKLDEKDLEQAIAHVKKELEKHGGVPGNTARMGKKTFARPLKKQNSGHYVVIMFKLEGSKMDAFKAHLKLNTNVFHFQFVKTTGEMEAVQEV